MASTNDADMSFVSWWVEIHLLFDDDEIGLVILREELISVSRESCLRNQPAGC